MNDELSTINQRVGDEALMGESGTSGDRVLCFSGFQFNSRRDELRRGERTIPLRPKPRALLRYLIDHPGRLLSKDELIGALWGPVVVTNDSLVQCVGELRAALGDRDQQLIKTLPRRGYMFDVAIEALRPSSDVNASALAKPPPLADAPAAEPDDPAAADTRRKAPIRWWLWPGIGALALAAAGAAWQMHPNPPFSIDEQIQARRATAVLRLVDADEAFSGSMLGNALPDEIATQISLRCAMRVIGRTATTRYDAGTPDIERIGRELKVRYVLSGRVVRVGDRVAIESYLSSVATGEVVRLNRADFATESDALNSNFALRVAYALRVYLNEVDAARLGQPGHRPDAPWSGRQRRRPHGQAPRVDTWHHDCLLAAFPPWGRPGFLVQRARLVEGLRKAGLPEK